MSKILVLDGSYILFKSLFSSKSMLNADGIDVSVAYKVLKLIITYILRYEPDTVHFVLDIGRDLKKKKKYEKYKANRGAKATANIYSHLFDNNLSKEQYERLETSKNIIINILSKTPVKIYAIPYIEGDTVCGGIALEEAKNGNNVIILTGDKDYLQLVNDNINVTFLPHGKFRPVEETYTINRIPEIWGMVKLKVPKDTNLQPHMMTYFRSIIGDISDNIGGVEGKGESFVNKMLNIAIDNNITSFVGFNDCIDFYKNVVSTVKEQNLKKSDKVRKVVEDIENLITIEKSLNQWKTSWEITDIKNSYNTLPSYALETLLTIFRNKKAYNINEFLEEIIKYEFDSIDDYKKWVAILECLNDGDWDKLQSRAGVGWYKMINVFNVVSEKANKYYNRLETKEKDDIL